jgi:hypothetical protein
MKRLIALAAATAVGIVAFQQRRKAAEMDRALWAEAVDTPVTRPAS